MLTFLQPVWLWAISGIIVPVAIHLWNVKQGKIMHVGSIALVIQSDRQQAKSLQLKDLLLLLLRCLLIIILSMLMAKPVIKKPLSASNQKGWLLMERSGLKETYQQYSEEIDSLLKAGYHFHFFEEEFPGGDLSAALKTDKDSIRQEPVNYWQLLQSLNQKVPDSLPVYLFTQNSLTRIAGNRPAIAMNLHWKTYTARDSIASYITQAYEDAKGEVISKIAKSTPGFTATVQQSFSRQNLPALFKIISDSGNTLIQYTDSPGHSSKVVLDTSSVNVAIYAGVNAHDAVYLQAAINAIKQVTGRKIRLSMVKNARDIPVSTDWLFWLSNELLPSSPVFKKVFMYALANERNHSTWVATAGKFMTGEEPISIRKSMAPELPNTQNVLWTNGYGDPLLTVEGNEKIIYRFYSRFDPGWSDLVWSSHFADFLLKLLIEGSDKGSNNHDKRTVAASQLLPVLQTQRTQVKENFLQTQDLSFIFWLVVFVLFCLERFLSFSKKKEEANG